MLKGKFSKKSQNIMKLIVALSEGGCKIFEKGHSNKIMRFLLTDLVTLPLKRKLFESIEHIDARSDLLKFDTRYLYCCRY